VKTDFPIFKLTDDEVEEMVENKQIDEDAYKKKILTKSQQGTLDAYYDEAIETRRDVMMLEGSLIELQEMFVAMAQLVAQQDDLIDNIENNVINADEYVKKGIEYVQAAKGHAEKSRVITIVILLIIVVALVVGGLVIAGAGIPIIMKIVGYI
jgi:t-SNARE complex subunit (syntaxin)